MDAILNVAAMVGIRTSKIISSSRIGVVAMLLSAVLVMATPLEF